MKHSPRWRPRLRALWPGAFVLAALAGPATAVAAPPVANVVAGKATFAVSCASCHQVGPSARGSFGPQLNDLLGRPAGSTPGYRYSPALQESKIVWSEQTLAAYIRNPSRTVPGTKMRFFSLGFGDQKMADLLAYLATASAAPKPTPPP